MSYKFQDAVSLSAIDVSNWNTSSITDMKWMFSEVALLKTLDISSWNTSNLEDSSLMFAYMYSLEFLDFSNGDSSSVTNADLMFDNSDLLQQVVLGPQSKFVDEVNLPDIFNESPLTGQWIRLDSGTAENPGVTSWIGSSAELISLSREAEAPGTYVWQFEANITFDPNSEDASGYLDESLGGVGVEHVLPESAFTRYGFEFTGWNTVADGSGVAYLPGGSHLFPMGTTVLYAQWNVLEGNVIVSFVDEQGNSIKDEEPLSGNVGSDFAITPAEIEGYTFKNVQDGELDGIFEEDPQNVVLVYAKDSKPTPTPTDTPTNVPTNEPSPGITPTVTPTAGPSGTPNPGITPTNNPSGSGSGGLAKTGAELPLFLAGLFTALLATGASLTIRSRKHQQ